MNAFGDNGVSLVVTGGRHYAHRDVVRRTLDTIAARYRVIGMWHGGATGADEHAHGWAISRGIQPRVWPGPFRAYGPPGGPLRNGWMVEAAVNASLADKHDVLGVVFPGGTGTASCKGMLEAADVRIVEPWEVL